MNQYRKAIDMLGEALADLAGDGVPGAQNALDFFVGSRPADQCEDVECIIDGVMSAEGRALELAAVEASVSIGEAVS